MVSRQTERLLANLKNLPLLEGYSLSIYSSGREVAPDKINRRLCSELGIPLLCNEICMPSLDVAIGNVLTSRKSVFFRCPLGLFSFSIPVSADSCLVCGGVRENLFDLYFSEFEQFEFMKGQQKVHPYEILEQLEKLPVTNDIQVRETMLKVERLVASFISGERMLAIDNALSGPITMNVNEVVTP